MGIKYLEVISVLLSSAEMSSYLHPSDLFILCLVLLFLGCCVSVNFVAIMVCSLLLYWLLIVTSSILSLLQWYAIMLDYVGEYEGTKERISKAYHIKDHFLVIMFPIYFFQHKFT